MNHREIDDRSVAARYLHHSLTPAERAEFEAHLVDCQECTDRVLLAEMFHNRNGHKTAQTLPPSERSELSQQPEALRVRFVRLLSPWQIFAILASAAAALVLVTASLLLWALTALRQFH